MMHTLFDTGTSFFHEHRLVRFAAGNNAPPPAPPAGPSAAPAPSPDPQPEAADPKMAFRSAQDRIKASGAKLQRMQQSLQQLRQMEAQVGAGGKPLDPRILARHGVTDTAGNGIEDDLQAKIKDTEAKAKPHLDEVNAASQEADKHLATIEGNGPGGRLDAAFMRVEAVMHNPNASIGEKIAAFVMAFKELKSLLKGETPAASTKPGGPTGSESRMSVAGMLKADKLKSLPELRTKKSADLQAREQEKVDVEGKLKISKQAQADSQNAVNIAKTNLTADPQDQRLQAEVRKAEGDVQIADANTKVLEAQLAQVAKAIATIKDEQKKIEDAATESKKALDKFNQSTTLLATQLDALAVKVTDPAQQQGLKEIAAMLRAEKGELDANEIDITLKIDPKDMGAFLDPFVKGGIDVKAMKVGANGLIEDPTAFLTAIEQLIAKIQAAATTK